MASFDCVGVDGSNPLGFLAAVGTLRAASGAFGPDVTMQWVHETRWYPRLEVAIDPRQEELLSGMNAWLAARAVDFRLEDPESGRPYKNLNVLCGVFRDYATTAATPEGLEALAAMGTDATGEETIEDTAFRTQSGAGHQHYLESIAVLAELTTAEDLERALFDPWVYEDETPYLRLDPNDDRRYALRWQNPSRQTKGFEIRTVRGANRLAVEGLRLHPVIPARGSNQTIGFQRSGRDTFWTWPVWDRPLERDVVRSVLALEKLQRLGTKDEEDRDRRRLHAAGVVQVFRSRRITIGKMRNFTPAEVV